MVKIAFLNQLIYNHVMEMNEILKKWKKTMMELDGLHQTLTKSGVIDLTENNIYLAITFVTKIYGLNSLFSDEFIKKHRLEQMVKWIDVETVKIQASHYSDKKLFFEFFNVIYPQLKYRYSQVSYYLSLSESEQKKLIITAEYQVYLTNLLKYYLEQQTTEEISNRLKEILQVVNLYKVVNDPNIVALGSEIHYMDTVSNEIVHAKIVIPSHANENHHKFSFNQLKALIGHKKDEIVCIDFSTSYFVRIVDVKNKEEKPTLH